VDGLPPLQVAPQASPAAGAMNGSIHPTHSHLKPCSRTRQIGRFLRSWAALIEVLIGTAWLGLTCCCCWAQDFVSTTTASTALADAFSALNEPLFAHPLASGEGRKQEDVVISFSHFVPRQELCPEKHQLNDPMLPKVRGFGDWLATPRLSDVRDLWLKYSKTAHWKLERS
jgi:hypothetical protein